MDNNFEYNNNIWTTEYCYIIDETNNNFGGFIISGLNQTFNLSFLQFRVNV